MINKALIYVATAFLLGTVTMVAPLILLKPAYYNLIISGGDAKLIDRSSVLQALDGEEISATLDEDAKWYGAGRAIARALSPSNLSSAGLVLIPSFFFALGLSLFVRKRIS